jgi:hypothetical protein
MATDNLLCKPIIDGERISLISFQAIYMAGLKETDLIPKTIMDLEQIQVLDYTQIPEIEQEQVDYINQKLRVSPFAPEDLAFLALKSLYCYSWDSLTFQTDAILALKVESALNHILKKTSFEIAGDLIYQDSLLPYWVRLSYLRVMSKIPEEVIERSNLKSVACFPNKRKSFNAFSTMLQNSSVVGFNYALEPILKILSRFLIHFYSTKHLSGSCRIARAWGEILPVVRYFNNDASASDLVSGCILISQDDATTVHRLVADQIDFIMMHELGHLFHAHPRKLSQIVGFEDELEKRHELEVEADKFAHEIYKSWCYEVHDEPEKLKTSLNEYAALIEAVELLFIFMRFVDESKSLINEKVGKKSSGSSESTHPSSDIRLSLLRKLSGLEVNSPIVQYAEKLFDDILFYIRRLSGEEIQIGLEPVIMRA